MIEAFSEQLITIDELRARMPHLRARETSLRSQIDALDAQTADRDAYLTLAGDLEGFLAQLRGNAATATVEDRQRVLRLLVKDILIGPEKITIRHRIPARPGSSGTRQRDPGPDTEGDHRPGYLLRWGREDTALGSSAQFPWSARTLLPGLNNPSFSHPAIYLFGQHRAHDRWSKDPKQSVRSASRTTPFPHVLDLLMRRDSRGPAGTRRNGGEPRLVIGLQQGADHFLQQLIRPYRQPQRRFFDEFFLSI